MFSNFCSSWIFYLPKISKHLRRDLSHVFIDETMMEPAREFNELSLILNKLFYFISHCLIPPIQERGVNLAGILTS